MKDPLEAAKLIGDKLMRDTPFAYRLDVAPRHGVFDRMHFVDFGRTYGLGRPAIAYAWTQLTAPKTMRQTIEIEHSDGCKIWLNGSEVYTSPGARVLNLRRDERSFQMSGAFEVVLQPGPNVLLVKSETQGAEWRIYLQPPSAKGAVVKDVSHPDIGLLGVKHLDGKVAALTNWLVVGPFPRTAGGLNDVFPPEVEFAFGRMYPGLDGPVTWTIPKVEVLGGLIDPLPWGTNYDWNYHNGGTAWAMQLVAEVTGEQKYADYASRFCDYHLNGIPFVEYQVKALNAVESANHWIVDTPLLDFTLAPSLPFIYRLRTEPGFPNRPAYEQWIGRMLHYARKGQVRLPGHGIYTRTTPCEYTTWVDDMFMGIPFLVQAALYVADERERDELFADAASQTIGFNSQVWDEGAELYMHARVFGSPVKLPHWSRCNGWAIWAMTEVLLYLPPTHATWLVILGHFQRHARSLIRLQDASGFWFNVLDRQDSPREVSGTAIFVMAMARGILHGWLDEESYRPVVERGWHAVASQIEADGTVHGICMGTMCTEDEEYYVRRPLFDNDTHGLFAVLFAAIEVSRMQDVSRMQHPSAKNSHRVSMGA